MVNGCFNTDSVYLGNLLFSCWITRVSISQWPEGVSSVNGCFNPNCLFGQFAFASWITRVSIFQWPEGVSSVNGCFNPNSVLGSLFYSIGS